MRGEEMKPVTKAFLLAAGLGTRLRPLTDRIPKCLVPINGRPLCDYWIALCEAHGIRDILMNTHHLAEQVEAYVAGLNRSITVHLANEPDLVGSAGTIRVNANFVQDEDAFLVVYADNLSNVNLTRLIDFHASHDGPVTVGAFRTDYPKQCGILTPDDEGRVVEFVEKPANPTSNLANAGLYVCDSSTISDIPDDKPVVDYGHDVLPRYVGRMYTLALDCYHLDVGNPESYAKAQATCPEDMPE
jgi:mannose-1-phosphate guanylyltransferase